MSDAGGAALPASMFARKHWRLGRLAGYLRTRPGRAGDQLLVRWAQIPEGTNVLITHGPSLGGRDQNYRGEHLGCAMLAEAVLRIRPLLHVFGHIHEVYGVAETQGMTLVNASICTLTYAPSNAPVVIDLP